MSVTVAVRDKASWETMLDSIEKGYVPASGKRASYESGWKLISELKALDAWKEGDRIVDIGCGNGRLAIPLTEFNIDYLGIDPIVESIEFCKKAFREWSGTFSFKHLDIQNDFYNPYGKINPLKFYVDIPDSCVDSVFLSSVLTHVGTPKVCEAYIKEVHRILRVGGKLYVTWFRSPPNDIEWSCERTVFGENFIINVIKDFEVERTWGGLSRTYHDQWCMILRKR